MKSGDKGTSWCFPFASAVGEPRSLLFPTGVSSARGNVSEAVLSPLSPAFLSVPYLQFFYFYFKGMILYVFLFLVRNCNYFFGNRRSLTELMWSFCILGKLYCLCFLRAHRVQAEYFPLNLKEMGEDPQRRCTGADGVGGAHGRPLGHASLRNSHPPAAITGEFPLPP